MKQGKPEPLELQPRYGQMNAQYSIQDVFDALVELITNADDAYHEIYVDGDRSEDGGTILIEIERHRGSKSSVIAIGDRAKGITDIRATLKKVGDRTSKHGDRGFMGRGLKDCAALGRVVVESIRDNRLRKAEITPEFRFIPYGNERGTTASAEDRRRLGIPHGNGTRVRLILEPRVSVPLVTKLSNELPWHFALQDITREGGPSRILLKAPGMKKPQLVVHVAPAADLVHDEEFPVPGYSHRARFTLWRAKEPLVDPPDRRFHRSGILVKGGRAIHSSTFFMPDLERDPVSEHYFGLLQCDGIDQLAEEWDSRRARSQTHPAANPILVIDPNRRTGLAENHPFTKALFDSPIQILKSQFEKEREQAKKSQQEVATKETQERLKKLAREASKFMREQLEDLGVTSPTDVVNPKSFVDKGLAIVPSFTQIATGDEKTFLVRVSGRLGLPLGTVVKPMLSKSAANSLELIGAAVDLAPDPAYEGALRGAFKIRAKEQIGRVQIGCQVDSLDPIFSEVQVVTPGPIDLEIPNNFSFHRQQYTVRPGSKRRLILRTRFDPPPSSPPTPSVRLSSADVATMRSRTAFDLVPGTTYYEAVIEVEGRKLQGLTRVIAAEDGRQAECDLRVVSKEEEGVDLEFKLVSHSLGQNYRAVWDRKQPNRLLITTQHETVNRYLGAEDDSYPGQHSGPFRVLLAELIADNVCRRIVEEHARALPHEFDPDKVYLLHNRLMKEFTPIAHRIQLSNPSAT